jgi:UDP-N-acetylmuramate--alanine ligase
MAIGMAQIFGTPTEVIALALASFKGVKRRFSYQIKKENLIYIDDYAHHPTEIDAVYQAVRELYPNKNVLAVFQPHLFSRTRDFAAEFAKSLSRFNEVILMDIYPARELPITGVTSEWLLNKIDNRHKQIVAKGDLIKTISKSTAQVIVTIGAGDIGELVVSIKEALNENI